MRFGTHTMRVERDEQDWYWLLCSCGHEVGPFPGSGEAEDEGEDHEAEVLSA